MNGVYLRGVTHTPTYPAVEELRPEDVNLDLPESLQIPAGRLHLFGSLCWALPCLFANMQLASICTRP
jgi:hypothetical protein